MVSRSASTLPPPSESFRAPAALTPSAAPSAAALAGGSITVDLADAEAVYLVQSLLEAQEKAMGQSQASLDNATAYERKADILGGLATRLAQAFARRRG